MRQSNGSVAKNHITAWASFPSHVAPQLSLAVDVGYLWGGDKCLASLQAPLCTC